MLHGNPAWWKQTGAEQEYEVLLTAGARQRQELFGGAQGVGNNAQLGRWHWCVSESHLFLHGHVRQYVSCAGVCAAYVRCLCCMPVCVCVCVCLCTCRRSLFVWEGSVFECVSALWNLQLWQVCLCYQKESWTMARDVTKWCTMGHINRHIHTFMFTHSFSTTWGFRVSQIKKKTHKKHKKIHFFSIQI